MNDHNDVNISALNRIAPELEKKHPHHVIVIQAGKVIAVGKGYKEALKKAGDRLKKDVSLVTRIGPNDEKLICLC